MNWETFKTMSVRKKVQWIIHYYGIAIIAAIVVIGVVCTMLNRFFGKQETYLAKIMILDDRCSEDDRLRMIGELEENFGGACEVTSYLVSDEDQFRAFVVRLSGDELDLVLAPEKEIRELEQNSYFQEVYHVEDGAYYYQITDEENHYPDKEIYLGKTGERETEPEILEQVIHYFLDEKK